MKKVLLVLTVSAVLVLLFASAALAQKYKYGGAMNASPTATASVTASPTATATATATPSATASASLRCEIGRSCRILMRKRVPQDRSNYHDSRSIRSHKPLRVGAQARASVRAGVGPP